jgi:acyl carrier protein
VTTELSLGQQGIWVTEQTADAGSAYHLPLLIHLAGPLDVDALLAAVDAVIDRHPLLSCGVREVDGEPRFGPGRRVPVRVAAPGESPRAEIAGRFDLEAGPLARFTLFTEGPGRHTLLAVAHHLVFDGRSKDVLVADLAAAYNGQPPGPPIEPAAPEPVALAEAREFWAARWREPGELAVLGVPIDGRYLGPAEEVRFTLPPGAPRIGGFTRFEVLVAALHACLAGYGNTEVATAVDLSTRPRRQNPEPIGSFANELPVYSRPAAELTFRELAETVRAELLKTYRYRTVPLARAVRQPRPSAAAAPVSISYTARRRPEPAFTGLNADVDWMPDNHTVRGGLRLQCSEGPGGLLVSVRHHPELPGERFAEDLRALLDAVGTDPDRRPATVTAPARPAPEPVAFLATQGFPPELTDQVRVIWQEVLGVETVADDDDIFDLGGHSLTITKIIARMRKQLELDVTLDDFFDSPTIGGVLATATKTRSP